MDDLLWLVKNEILILLTRACKVAVGSRRGYVVWEHRRQGAWSNGGRLWW